MQNNILEQIDLGKLHKDAVKVAAEVENGLQSLLFLLLGVTPILVVSVFLTLRYDVIPSWEIASGWIDSMSVRSPELKEIATLVVVSLTLTPAAAQFLGKKMSKLPIWAILVGLTFLFDFLGDGVAVSRDLEPVRVAWVGAAEPTTQQITEHLVGYIGYVLVWFSLTTAASVVSEALTIIIAFLFVAFFMKSFGFWLLRLRKPKQQEKKPEPKVVSPDGQEVRDERFREAREVPPFNRQHNQGKKK